MSRFCRLLCILLVFLCGLTSVGKSNETHDLRIRITTQEGVDLGYGLTRNPDNAGLKDVCIVVMSDDQLKSIPDWAQRKETNFSCETVADREQLKHEDIAIVETLGTDGYSMDAAKVNNNNELVFLNNANKLNVLHFARQIGDTRKAIPTVVLYRNSPVRVRLSDFSVPCEFGSYVNSALPSFEVIPYPVEYLSTTDETGWAIIRDVPEGKWWMYAYGRGHCGFIDSEGKWQRRFLKDQVVTQMDVADGKTEFQIVVRKSERKFRIFNPQTPVVD
ncbi:MAG: hypothetical protein KDA87_21980 [Planctomycetales bacterium]|nr:hypothetical protein [Planctomycetales bacterium]